MEIEALARMLQTSLKTPVLDETGMGGWYLVNLHVQGGGTYELVRVLREEAGLELSTEFRDFKVVVVEGGVEPNRRHPPRYGCEPDIALRGLLDRMPALDEMSHSWEQRVGPRRALFENSPGTAIRGHSVPGRARRQAASEARMGPCTGPAEPVKRQRRRAVSRGIPLA